MIIKYRDMAGALERLQELLETYFGKTRRIYEESREGILACLFAFSRDEYYVRGFNYLERFLADFSEKRIESNSYFISISERKSGYEKIPELYTQAVCRFQKFFFTGYGSFVQQEEKEKQVADPAQVPLKNFELALLETEARQALDLAEQSYLYLKEQKDSLPDNVKNIFFSFQIAILHKSDGTEKLLEREAEQNYLWLQFCNFETIEECYVCLKKNISAYFENKESFLSGSLKIDQVIRYVRTGFGDANLSIRDIADAVGLTPQYMTAVFKEKTGITLGQFIRSTRLEHSRRLLEASELSLGAIAQASGYGDANYWAKAFRKEYGMAPSDYRKQGQQR
ncbi:helix-turn-helix domain-containing protein [Parablautia intestinalis]|jgi:two-component system response regulator YesN|uniref:Helix-turn-helix domain-containing protein n=1 Tax=Parablautia intestinalis TaxID=2320100 RepID=A0A3A9AJM1_9FIRM|nr:helix-turn-helix transcriptional regulator [Parablautia intestinalis]RKI91559.1 helix-turn-helix domain-containing protein [Parablautia intestinalis]